MVTIKKKHLILFAVGNLLQLQQHCAAFSLIPAQPNAERMHTTLSQRHATAPKKKQHSTTAKNYLQNNDATLSKERRVSIEEATLQHLNDTLAPAGRSVSIEDANLETDDTSILDSKTLLDSDFVFVGNQTAMQDDAQLKLLSSELSVWKQFRQGKEDDAQKSFPWGLPVDLFLERTWDTVEDVFVHLRRVPYEKGGLTLSPSQDATRKNVVILGSGWASHALMKVADCNKLRLTVVSPSNHFVFTPMLASAAVGTVEYRSMTEAVRAANPMIHEYLEGAATNVDIKNKTVTVQMSSLLHDNMASPPEAEPPTLTLNYDHLVVACGSRVDDRNVPGAEHALRLKSTDDARRLRTAVGECFEYASRPDTAGDTQEHVQERSRRVTFLIVGGGPTGIELSGELHDLFQDITRPHKGTYPKLKDAVRVILAHGGPDLVPQFEPALRAEALKSLEKKGVEVMLNTRVTQVGEGFAKLSTKVLDVDTGKPTGQREETTLPVGLTVWCAGTAPVSFVEKLMHQLPMEARHQDGRVKVDRWMRPPVKEDCELGSVFVVGDAAAFEEQGALLPATAQVAGQEGAFLARLLDRHYDTTTTPPKLRSDSKGATLDTTNQTTTATTLNVFHDPAMQEWLRFRGIESAPPFGFLNLGMLAYLGGGEALTQLQLGDVSVLRWAGSAAFVLWRSVYLVKQVATRNRILVTFDWIKSAIFGRDTTRL